MTPPARQHRHTRRLSLAALARATGYSPAYLRTLEAEGARNHDQAAQLASHYGCDVACFIPANMRAVFHPANHPGGGFARSSEPRPAASGRGRRGAE